MHFASIRAQSHLQCCHASHSCGCCSTPAHRSLPDLLPASECGSSIAAAGPSIRKQGFLVDYVPDNSATVNMIMMMAHEGLLICKFVSAGCLTSCSTAMAAVCAKVVSVVLLVISFCKMTWCMVSHLDMSPLALNWSAYWCLLYREPDLTKNPSEAQMLHVPSHTGNALLEREGPRRRPPIAKLHCKAFQFPVSFLSPPWQSVCWLLTSVYMRNGFQDTGAHATLMAIALTGC